MNGSLNKQIRGARGEETNNFSHIRRVTADKLFGALRPPATLRKMQSSLMVGEEAHLPCVSGVCGPVIQRLPEGGIMVKYAYKNKGSIHNRSYLIESGQNHTPDDFISEVTLKGLRPYSIIGNLHGVSLDKQGKPVDIIGDDPVWTVITKSNENGGKMVLGSVVASKVTEQEALGKIYLSHEDKPVARISLTKEGRFIYNISTSDSEATNDKFLRFEEQNPDGSYELANTLIKEILSSTGIIDDIRQNPQSFFDRYAVVVDNNNWVLTQAGKPIIVFSRPELEDSKVSNRFNTAVSIAVVQLLGVYADSNEGKSFKASLAKASKEGDKRLLFGDIVYSASSVNGKDVEHPDNIRIKLSNLQSLDSLVSTELGENKSGVEDFQGAVSDIASQFFTPTGSQEELLRLKVETAAFGALHRRVKDNLHEVGHDVSKATFEVADDNIYLANGFLFYKVGFLDGKIDKRYPVANVVNSTRESLLALRYKGFKPVVIGDKYISLTFVRKRSNGTFSVRTIIVPNNFNNREIAEGIQAMLNISDNIDHGGSSNDTRGLE